MNLTTKRVHKVAKWIVRWLMVLVSDKARALRPSSKRAGIAVAAAGAWSHEIGNRQICLES